MNMRAKTVIVVTTLFTLMSGALARAQDTSATNQPSFTEEAQPLQGTWKGAEIGREAEGECRITFADNMVHFQGANKDEWYKATFALPAGTNPKQLIAKITECPGPQFVGKSTRAIFKIEEGKLTLVGNKPGVPEAPESFAGDATSRTFVFTKLERE